MRRELALSAIVIVLGLALRLPGLAADPPPWHGLGFIADEGWWAANARNRVLFGELVLSDPRDEFNQGLVLSPTFTLLCFTSFSVFGPSLWSLRLVSAAMSAVTAAALALACRSAMGEGAAPRAAIFYLFSPFAWAFGRVGLVEETMNACLAVALAGWLARGAGWHVLAGLAHAAAFATKSYASFAGVAILASLLIPPVDAEGWRPRLRRFFAYAAGAGIGLALWAALVYVPHRDEYRELSLKLSQDNLPRSPAVALRNACDLLLEMEPANVTVASIVRLGPVVAVLAAAGLAGLLLLPLPALRRDAAAAIAVPLVAVYAALLAPMQYKPDRRYYVLLLPGVLLACWACRHLATTETRAAWPRRVAAAVPIAALAAALPAALLGNTRNRAAVAWAAGTLVLVPASAAVLPALLRVLGAFSRVSTTAAILVFALVAGREMERLSFSMVRESQALDRLVGGGPVLGGVAHTLLLGSRAKVYNSMRKGTSGRFNQDIATRANVRWVVTWTQPERPAPVEVAPAPGRLVKVHESSILPRPGGGFRAAVALWRVEPPDPVAPTPAGPP